MNCFVAAGGMKSPIGVIQRIGRALRIAPGKTEAVIVDFRDSGRYLGDHFQERYETYCNIFGDYVT
jgi:superfamily II DNA or RNA helicase